MTTRIQESEENEGRQDEEGEGYKSTNLHQ